jgi:hypothetical protein
MNCDKCINRFECSVHYIISSTTRFTSLQQMIVKNTIAEQCNYFKEEKIREERSEE